VGTTENKIRVLVTGGGGFVGSALAKELVKQGYFVNSFSRGDYPELRKWGIKTIRGDLANKQEVFDAVAGHSIVIHTAALAGFWGKAEKYQQANVVGTHNVIDACLHSGTDRLIYTGTASVVFDGRDILNGRQDMPYSRKPLNPYCKTKAIAEQMVLRANGPSLKTISLRPHLVFGPGDNHIIPRLIDRARKGKIMMIGGGDNRVDMVYIDNLVDAHILAINALIDNPLCCGKAYFITNGEPVNVWQFIGKILKGAGLPPVHRNVTVATALFAARFISSIHKLLPFLGEPSFTPFLVKELATNHWFDPEPAKRDLNYRPTISMKDGLERLIEILSP